MIDKDQLHKLLDLSESETIDFKSETYRLDGEDSNSKFIKDIVAMANTPRDEPAYIIVGVKEMADGSNQLHGVLEHHDDADLQDKLNLAKVEPRPTFLYQNIALNDRSFGVIEIPVNRNGPFLATRDYGVLKAHRIYFRRGTKNDVASPEEIKHLYQWFQNIPAAVRTHVSEDRKIPNWDELSLACRHFDSDRLYAFVIGPGTKSKLENWEHFARLPISLVLDFDPASEEDGAFSKAGTLLRKRRSVHLWTLDNRSTLNVVGACYWYAARGLAGRDSSLSGSDWRKWNRAYGTPIQQLVNDYAAASGGRPLTVVSLWHAPEYLRVVCTAFDRSFGDAVNFVFAVPNADGIASLANQFDGTAIDISVEEVMHGIAQNISSPDEDAIAVAGLPTLDGTFHALDRATLNWLSEDFEILHSSIELEASERQLGRDYLRGLTIDWADLDNHFDADRDKTAHMQATIENDLMSRTTVRLNLYHWPGAGGTTVARRIAWNLRRRFPVVLLRHITTETVGRFRELFKTTGLPTLALVEGSDTMPERLDTLYSQVKTENVPVVFLSVFRRFQVERDRDRSVFLGQNLSISESHRFMQAFLRVAPDRKDVLERIDSQEGRDRTPFHFALTAFGKDYAGITNYVESRLGDATSDQRCITTYLALAYYYGHKALSPQVFTPLIGYSPNRTVRLEMILDSPQLELLVNEVGGKWRPVHQLVAEEVLKIVLSGAEADRRNWKRNLPVWAIDFIKLCRTEVETPSDELIDILRRVFILRDEHELLGTERSGSTQFSLLIEDIQTDEGQLSILKELAESFPDEAHFWGHLGRFYSIKMGEYELAINALDNAIEIARDDSVLHHMKGMCFRSLAYAQIRDIDGTSGEIAQQESIANLQAIVEDAEESFERARELNPDSEHAYISPAQMLLRVLDFGFTHSGRETRAEFLALPKSGWYREKLDEVEGLLDSVRGVREGDRPSQYIQSCEANLELVYDDYSRALQGWTNLLSQESVYAPPVRRQIARAYLSRSKRSWSALESREIERIVDLMEDNLREEPGSEHNIRMWFRAIRYSPRGDIDLALDRLATWKSVGDSRDAYLYLYILHALKAIEGSLVEKERALDLIEQSRQRARFQRNRTRSFEWLGRGAGMGRLIHFSELGNWTEELDFYPNVSRLERVEGRIQQIKGPEAGVLELSTCGLPAFFVPAKAGVERGRDENLKAEFFIGFSYEGLRAWSVEVMRG